MDRPTTADLFAEEFALPDTKFDPLLPRLSQAGDCVRKHALRVTGHSSEEYSTASKSVFKIGHVWADVIAEMWERRFPGGVRREVEVHLPEEFAGVDVGHIDLYIEPLNHMVEVKTTGIRNLRMIPMDSHKAQCQMYHHFWGVPRNATMEIVYVFRESLSPVSLPVLYEPDSVEPLLENLRVVLEAKRTGVLPEIPLGLFQGAFPCSWGRKGVHKCAYYDWCW